MKLLPLVLTAAALVAALFGAFYFLARHPGGARSGIASKVAWQRMAEPGKLSGAHAFLEHNCAACHTPVAGVEARNCIVCHANDQSLLQRQPTAFHADVRSCVECHAEHDGAGVRPTQMNHAALASVALLQIGMQGRASAGDRAEGPAARDRLIAWMNHADDSPLPPGRQAVTPREAALNCTACHANEDRHRGFFGSDCVQCHTTAAWTVAGYRHPSPTSTSCVQCHQAPPSHYMMHFKMISMTVAHQEHADVSQCYLCHETTSWNDIKGVGWYKHH